MTEPSLAFQKAVVERLRANAALTALVPVANIFDRSGLPQISPCVILGEDETRREPIALADSTSAVATTIHVWAKEPSTVLVKRISGLIQLAMRDRFWTVDGHDAIYTRLSLCRYVRDPGGEWTHGVLTFETLLAEAVA